MSTKDFERHGRPLNLEIYDTAGQEAYAEFRNSMMAKGDVGVHPLKTLTVNSPHLFFSTGLHACVLSH